MNHEHVQSVVTRAQELSQKRAKRTKHQWPLSLRSFYKLLPVPLIVAKARETVASAAIAIIYRTDNSDSRHKRTV